MRCKEYVAGKIPADGGAFAGRDWGKFDIQKEIIDLCPTKCMQWDGKKLSINNAECNRCMHCIDAMPEALRVGKDQGVSILFGAKAPILEGAQMACTDDTFHVCETSRMTAIKALVGKVFDWWIEEGKNRERIGETIQRVSLKTFIEVLGIPPMPQMVKEPRSNPYVFFKEDRGSRRMARGILTITEPDIQDNIKEGMLCRKANLVILIPKSLRKAG